MIANGSIQLATKLLRISLFYDLAIQWAKHVIESTSDPVEREQYKGALECLEHWQKERT